MTMREEFERQMIAENACTRLARQSESVGGEYRTVSVERAWLRFQAAYAAGQRAERQSSQESRLMGECMDMVRQDLIDAGVIEKTVPPMMIPEAVARAMGNSVKVEREACRKACREAVLALTGEQRQSGDMLDHAIEIAIRNRKEQG